MRQPNLPPAPTALLVCSLLALGLAGPAAAAPPLARADALTVELERPTSALALPDPRPLEAGEAAWTWLRAEFAKADPETGAPDPATLSALAERAASSEGPVVVELIGGHPAFGRFVGPDFVTPAGERLPEPPDAERRAFARFLRESARALAGKAAWYLVTDALPKREGEGAGRIAAFEIKSAAVALRAEDPGAGVAFRLPGPGFAALARAAYRATGDLEPYVDGLALGLDWDEPERAERVGELVALVRELDPGALAIAALERPGESGAPDATALLRRAASTSAAGAALTLLDPRGASEEALAALGRLARALGPGLAPSAIDPDDIALAESDAPLRFARFFDSESFDELLVYWSESPTPLSAEDARARFVFDAMLRRGYQVDDLLSGRERLMRAAEAGEGRVAVEVPLGPAPRVLLVRRQAVSPGFEGEGLGGEADVAGTRVISAEEIIAAHQRQRAFEEERLESARREGELSLRIRYGQSTGTIDVTFRSDYLWRRGLGAEWVLRETLVNGVKLDWERIPELPFLSREQVVALPLDLNLDRRYAYEYLGEEEVEGRSCWVLSFRPLDDELSLYRGRVWIDRATAAMVRVSSIQTNLTPPLMSDEVTQTFRPFAGPDGTQFWLLDGIEGQQIFSVSGGNLVVLREARFGPPSINAPGFDEALAEVHASEAQVLRETPEGFKWLARNPDGTRSVREEGDRRALLAGGGLLRDESTTEGVLPLLGLNYTDIDFLERDLLLNVFFAGVIGNVNVSDPSFLDTRVDLGVTLNVQGIPGTDRVFRPEPGGGELEEVEAERVRRLPQSLLVQFGYPLGSFVKLSAGLGLSYVRYHRDEETESFLPPSDHFLGSALLELAYDRRGWGFLVRGRAYERSEWEAWGPSGALVSGTALDEAQAYATWEASAQKSFFLPYFQKFEIDAVWRQGSDLDRFSAFTFGFLSGDRLRGFGGAGIRYEEGLQAGAQYSFNLAEVVRFDANLDYARVRELGLELESEHWGFGVAANFVGPWQTLLRVDVGYALESDLEAVEGDLEFLVLALRLF